MRLTRAGEYAVRCVAFLTTLRAGELATRKEVAEHMEIPPNFLAKITPLLARAGLLNIVQGANGGLSLARPASEITLLDVVEATIGSISLNDCVLRPGTCQRSPTCPIHTVWTEANRQLRDTLAKADFATLVQGDLCMRPLLQEALDNNTETGGAERASDHSRPHSKTDREQP